MASLPSIFFDAIHLFYPHNCTGCGSDLLNDDQLLCLQCINLLPHTNFAQHANNPIEKIFWGRIPLVAAHSEFYFAKETLLQHLIHQLKYKGNQEIGFFLGELMGNSLLNSNRFKNLDYLLPLPLYPEKERKRGYNQAAVICKGISARMQIPVMEGNLVRRRFTETQTKKHRRERWENVVDSFLVKDPAILINRNLLLVDDVITTGASLESCGHAIAQSADVKLSIATLSMAIK
jgi:ComF family protein